MDDIFIKHFMVNVDEEVNCDFIDEVLGSNFIGLSPVKVSRYSDHNEICYRPQKALHQVWKDYLSNENVLENLKEKGYILEEDDRFQYVGVVAYHFRRG